MTEEDIENLISLISDNTIDLEVKNRVLKQLGGILVSESVFCLQGSSNLENLIWKICFKLEDFIFYQTKDEVLESDLISEETLFLSIEWLYWAMEKTSFAYELIQRHRFRFDQKCCIPEMVTGSCLYFLHLDFTKKLLFRNTLIAVFIYFYGDP